MLFDPVGGTGILVERASWWNGHLGGTGILPVTISGRPVPTLALGVEHEGKPAPNTPYAPYTTPHTSHTSHTPHTLTPIPDSRFPIPDFCSTSS
ncbi:MAG: hypothetical protein F6K56_19585 [Moorea sp. SIO3G5]|nr:hypothetical protein [Moorena sp. SIO3G5]